MDFPPSVNEWIRPASDPFETNMVRPQLSHVLLQGDGGWAGCGGTARVRRLTDGRRGKCGHRDNANPEHGDKRQCLHGGFLLSYDRFATLILFI